MLLEPLAYNAPLTAFEGQAAAVLAAWEGEAPSATEARGKVAHWYGFATWADLEAWLAAVREPGSAAARFEAAVEAVIDGDAEALRRMLAADPELVRARSERVTPQDPPVHGATLLHYLAANGVENLRQRSPANAVEMARILLEAGADPNALAGMYGGRHAVMSLLVSSTPPAEAGVQAALVEVLAAYGASVEPAGAGAWSSPLLTALVFGFLESAETLVRLGARVDTLPAAAGLGRLEQVEEMLPAATAEARHRALAMAAGLGRIAVARRLLEAGEDPNRFNPPGMHAHSTPLHQAALRGDRAMVELLLAHGARTDLRDTMWQGTALGWAEHGGRTDVAALLRARAGSL